MLKSPQAAVRNRSASIPVIPEGFKALGSNSRYNNVGYLPIPNSYPLSTVLPRSAPELSSDEIYPHQLQDQLSARLSERMILRETSSLRRRCTEPHKSHHNRSLSLRTMKRPTHQQIQEEFRPRVSTMPSDRKTYIKDQRKTYGSQGLEVALDLQYHEPTEEQYLIRNFSITPKGVINRGDLVRQRSRSNNSVCSLTSSLTGGASTANSCSSERQNNHSCKVLMLGAIGVGKTSLVAQFMTSEYMNMFDSTQEEGEEDKCVSVLLDGEEYDLNILDTDSFTKIMDLASPEIDAYVVVYSVTDRTSFQKAVDILFDLKELPYTVTKAVILVGNKSDLMRSRQVGTDEGKATACSYNCKFVETSAAINHNVDELLVGVVSQIHLKSMQGREGEESSPKHRRRRSRGSLESGHRARGIISKLLGKENSKSKSCDNLHVL